jgi:hypothetical protein
VKRKTIQETTMEQDASSAKKKRARFEEPFEQFGEQMAAWGEEFGRQMEAWGKEFEARMEAWGKEFGPRMEAWGKDLGRRMEEAGERVEEWFEGETPAAETDDLQAERLAILHMLEEDKISVAEAERLLRAVGH